MRVLVEQSKRGRKMQLGCCFAFEPQGFTFYGVNSENDGKRKEKEDTPSALVKQVDDIQGKAGGVIRK